MAEFNSKKCAFFDVFFALLPYYYSKVKGICQEVFVKRKKAAFS